jgi:hypothetical protein
VLKDHLAGLSGHEFDREYVKAMIEGHKEAVADFELAASSMTTASFRAMRRKRCRSCKNTCEWPRARRTLSLGLQARCPTATRSSRAKSDGVAARQPSIASWMTRMTTLRSLLTFSGELPVPRFAPSVGAQTVVICDVCAPRRTGN